MLLSATYIMNAAWGRRPRWTISQDCEWQVKGFELAGRTERELGERAGLGLFGKAKDLPQRHRARQAKGARQRRKDVTQRTRKAERGGRGEKRSEILHPLSRVQDGVGFV